MERNPTEQVYTVALLNKQVRLALERNYAGIWLEAEVVQARTYQSGHVYFELSDPGGNAHMSAVMWRGTASRYGNRIVEGARIRCFGKVTLYEAGGKYQFVAERVLDSGAGEKARALAELKEKLGKEGLFAPERKRPLPPWPRCVGVVTSREGAALRDIITVASRRFPVRFLLAHASVQGAAAPGEIAAAVAQLGSRDDVDVMIVGRGGGSSEDLDAFNDEGVVRAIAQCPTPVVCAVGHEVDVSLADLVADKRAATPSEAAEFVVPDVQMVEKQLRDLGRRMTSSVRMQLGEQKEAQMGLHGRLTARDPRVRLRKQLERLAVLREFLSHWPTAALSRGRGALERSDERLLRWSRTATTGHKGNLVAATHGIYSWPGPVMERARGDLGRLAASLDALSPLASLGRGYAIVRRRDGAIIKRANEAEEGTDVDITLSEGELRATVKKVLPGKKDA